MEEGLGNKNYTVYHLHDMESNCNGFADSCTSFSNYIELAKQNNMSAIAISNHGGIYEWITKKQLCDKSNIKYIHGVELYLCENLEDNHRGWHIGLYSKNWEGVKELNTLISKATSKGSKEDKTDRAFYYNPRISIDQLKNTSDNIIITTACLASVFWQEAKKVAKAKINDELNQDEKNLIISTSNSLTNDLLCWMGNNNHRVFLEVQAHDNIEQSSYNKILQKYSKKYNIPLIAGTDTHSSTDYKAECRNIFQKSKGVSFGDEDAFDLTWKTYDEFVDMFRKQNVLDESVYLEAIENTNVFADMIEPFELDYNLKYPTLYGKNAKEQWKNLIFSKLKQKLEQGIIPRDRLDEYKSRIMEEFAAMTKQGMESFMMFMSELITWCWDNDIPVGYCRGSVGGSLIAYVTDITDVDAIRWNTTFSRFCNADRISMADIDVDISPKDRKKVYDYIIERFGVDKICYIAQFGTIKDRKAIDILAKGLDYSDISIVKKIKDQHEELFKEYTKIVQEEINIEELEDIDLKSIDFDHAIPYSEIINNSSAKNKLLELSKQFEDLKLENKDIFYYFDGIKGTVESKGRHNAGIIGSPISTIDNLGVFYKDGDEHFPVSFSAMKGIDSLSYAKFDILCLNTMSIMKDFYKYVGLDYKKSHDMDFEDKKVWDSMLDSPHGFFQMEGDYAFELLSEFKPQQINDISLVNASIRPSGKSYRDKLMSKEIHKNPSNEIDELLKDNYGYLIYQEDTIKFLTDICGFSGSEADSLRRYIGKKDKDALKASLPKILDGYCDTSSQPRETAEREAKEFIQIIADSAEYQFGLNHSTGYSLIGYSCMWARTYYPLEFTTAYLNNAKTEDDLQRGDELCKLYNITVNSIKFGYSESEYMYNKETNSIFKGMESIKFMNDKVSTELYNLSQNNTYENFPTLLLDIISKTSINSRQLKILTSLNFFSEFGENKTLLDYTKYFDILNGKKQFKKSNIHDNNFEIDEITKEKSHLELAQFESLFIENSRETAKTYMDLDTNAILLSIWNRMEDSKLPLRKQIEIEIEYLGYIETKIPTISDNIYFVTEFKIYDKKRPKPYVNLYNIKEGTYLKTRVDSDKDFIEAVFNLHSIIRINKFVTKPKFKIVDHKYAPTGETHELIKNWEVMQ